MREAYIEMLAIRDQIVLISALIVIVYLLIPEFVKNARIKSIINYAYIAIFYASLAGLAITWSLTR